MTGAEAILAAGWGVAAGLLVALGITIWVLNAILFLLRRGGRPPEAGGPGLPVPIEPDTTFPLHRGRQ